jgi:YHS domain-containing protein
MKLSPTLTRRALLGVGVVAAGALAVDLAVSATSGGSTANVVREAPASAPAAPAAAARPAVVAQAPAAPAAAPATPAPANLRAPLIFSSSGNLALDGFDAVAYFTAGQPTRGTTQFTHEWRGATWRFASAANRDAFAASPERYAPQYGGYCAWATAEGYRAPGLPQHWRIVEGKLYVNASAGVQRTWERDIPGFIRRADANWPTILTR